MSAAFATLVDAFVIILGIPVFLDDCRHGTSPPQLTVTSRSPIVRDTQVPKRRKGFGLITLLGCSPCLELRSELAKDKPAQRIIHLGEGVAVAGRRPGKCAGAHERWVP